MANIRVRIKNTKDLETMLPKLKRSLSVQHNVELEEEDGGKGVFVLVVKEAIQLDKFALIKKLLDSYGFEFFIRTVDMDGNEYDPEQDEHQEQPREEPCNCEVCRGMRALQQQQQEQMAAMQQLTDLATDKRAQRKVKIAPIKTVNAPVPVPTAAGIMQTPTIQPNEHQKKRAMQEQIAKELLAAVAKMKKDLAR